MSAHVLLNYLNELGKKLRCEAVPNILSVFSNELNKFNNTGARMQDSIYHMTLNSHFISEFRTTLYARSFRSMFFAYHHAVNHPHANIILS